MAIRNIRIMGDPILEKVCKEIKEVTPRIKELIEDMLETMYDANGVGLAAPQVGVLKRIAQTGKVLVEVDPKYFRPAEVEQLLGDPTKAKTSWVPKIIKVRAR